MRVLFWSQRFRPHVGGVEVHATRFLPAMRRRGFEFAVLTSPGTRRLPETDEFDGIPVHRLPFESALAGRDPEAVLRLRSRVVALKRSFRPDLVHFQLTDPTVLFHLLTLDAHPSPTLLSLRVMLEGELGEADLALRKALLAADWITANSKAVEEDMRAKLASPTPRSSTIYNALDPPGEAPAELSFSPPRLLVLGRMVPDKGVDVALRALPLLLERHPDARMILAGDGPERPSLQELVDRLGLGSHVEFRGWVRPDRVAALLNEATVVVVPSRWREAFGLVALQAAQMGRPVVASRTGGLPEVVEDGRTGILFPVGDHCGLAHAAVRLLDDPAECRAMGREGLLRAGQRFAWEAHLEAYERLYHQLGGLN